MKVIFLAACTLAVQLFSAVTCAADNSKQHPGGHHASGHAGSVGASSDAQGRAKNQAHAGSHAPIGVMGDHMHKVGEWMVSYRPMYMSMNGNQDGGTSLSPEQVITQPNRFAMPANLRVVPTGMTMSMHMLGVMYVPSDRLTLMGMTQYVEKKMDHITFQGMSGTNRLGNFTTNASGIGDTSLSTLIKLGPAWHAQVGVSLPTGDIKQTDTVLTPMGTSPTLRLPYMMQLGSGTYDALLGATYNRVAHTAKSNFSWGGQWRSTLRLGENSEHYTFGDEHRLTGWVSYGFSHALSVSTRLEWLKRENIDGIDAVIMAPVQTADPDRQALDRLDFGLGLNWLLPKQQHRLSMELSMPITEHMDGPQMKTDYQVVLGWQYSP
jgi:hypothetical protein